MIDLGRSRTRDAVVRELFSEPHVAFHVRGLARRTGEAVANVHRELRRLERAGWVLRGSEKNRVLYRVNESHPLYAEMERLVAKTVGVPRVVGAALFDVPGIEFAALVDLGEGSSLGAATPLRLLVVAATTDPGPDVTAAVRPAEQWLGRTITSDVVGVNELRRRVGRGEPSVLRLLSRPRTVLVGDEHRLRALLGHAAALDGAPGAAG